MTYFNQFHKEASERKMRKIEESRQSPMNYNFSFSSSNRSFLNCDMICCFSFSVGYVP